MNKHTEELFKKLYVPLVSFIEEIIGDHEEAKTIAVDVFRCNSDQIERYKCSEDITEIAQVLLKESLIVSFIFLRKRKEQAEAEKVFQELADDLEASVEDAKIEQELRQLVKKGNSKLSKIQNLALSLFGSDVQTEDAARIMEISPSTFRNTKRAAIKKYKKVLASGGFIVIVMLLILSVKALQPVAKREIIKPSKTYKIKSWKNHIKK